MTNMTVTLYRDADGNYFSGGKLDTISSTATQIGKVWLAAEDIDLGSAFDVQEGTIVPASHPVKKIAALQVKDRQKGILVIADTSAQLSNKAQPCCQPTTTVPATTVPPTTIAP